MAIRKLRSWGGEGSSAKSVIWIALGGGGGSNEGIHAIKRDEKRDPEILERSANLDPGGGEGSGVKTVIWIGL